MVEKSVPAEGEVLLCSACGAPYDPDDDFCRKCGASLSGRLPAVRRNYQPTLWQPPVPVIVQGAAAVVAGTLAEILIRRLVSRIFRPRSLLPILRRGNKKQPLELVPQSDDGMEPEAQLESETVVFRQVRLRRRRSQ